MMRNLSLTSDRFGWLCDGLASAALSEMTRHRPWHVDRARAIPLIAIGALNAHRQNGDALIALRRPADHARSQRSRGQPLLRACIDEVTDALGSVPPLC